MKIALVLLPMWSIEAAPLGLASLSAALKNEGHEVKSFDLNVSFYRKLGPAYWELANSSVWGDEGQFTSQMLPKISGELVALAREIVDEKFQAVGFTMYKTNARAIGWMCTLLKFLSPELKIVIGGPEVGNTEGHRLIHLQYADIVEASVVGEGEGSALALFKAWQNGESIAGLPGVIVVRDRKIEFSGRPAPLNVNTLLPPDFSDFDLKSYGRASLPVQFSRGCVANCSFCNEKAFLWPSFQMKNAAGVLDHMRHLAETYEVSDFWAADSLLNGNHTKLAEFVQLVLAGDFHFSWGGNMRIDKRLKGALSENLKKAGCYWVTFGLESGSNKILKSMRKGITRDDILSVLSSTHETGIRTDVNLIVGFPGETEEDFQDTLGLLDEVGHCMGMVSTTIFATDPHTDVGRNPKKYGILTDEAGQVVRDYSSPYLGNDWLSESGDSTPAVRLDRLYRLRERVRARLPQADLLQILNG